MSSLTLFSPAKINLFIRVLAKRRDGYHDLASLFQTVDLGDTISYHLDDQDDMTCNDPSVPLDGRNLIWKAVSLFRLKTATRAPVRIHLQKRIPLEAGLGGGSSNAATTLWALNELHGKPASVSELAEWAAEIGSDISFFFSKGTAYCTGRGEKVRSLPPIRLHRPLALVKPPMGLSTAEIFRKLDLATCSSHDPEDLLSRIQDGNPLYINDLEKSAFIVLPALKTLKAHLDETGFSDVVMTGSGTGFLCFGTGSYPSLPLKLLQRGEGRWYLPLIPL